MYLQLVAQVVYYCTSQWAPLQYFFSTRGVRAIHTTTATTGNSDTLNPASVIPGTAPASAKFQLATLRAAAQTNACKRCAHETCGKERGREEKGYGCVQNQRKTRTEETRKAERDYEVIYPRQQSARTREEER